MNFMEEVNEETQAMLKQISIRKAEKTANATKRIAELKNLLNFGSKTYENYVRTKLNDQKTKILWCINEIIYLMFHKKWSVLNAKA